MIWNRLFKWIVAGVSLTSFVLSSSSQGVPDPGSGSDPSATMIGCWQFSETNSWQDASGYGPISFTNLSASLAGDGLALLLDSTNAAWINYNIVTGDGWTNLMVDQGTVSFWLAPSWTSVSAGGTGCGVAGRLVEVGSYTPDSSVGWWGLYLDAAGDTLSFSAQTNDFSSNCLTYLSAPISWSSNRWHFVALSYSATNTCLYLDGALAASGPGMTVWPGGDVLTNGFCIGSDFSGVLQAHGAFDDVFTFSSPLDGATVLADYNWQYVYYLLNPMNSIPMDSAPFDSNGIQAPSDPTKVPNVITGAGNLQWLGGVADYLTNASVWLTNYSSVLTSSNTSSFTFAIGGGCEGLYDVFATTELSSTNGQWAWMGQGYRANRYCITNLPTSAVFFILGTSQDSDGDGLTDAYERLVSHTDPHNADPNNTGMPQGWQVWLGLDPSANIDAQPKASYSYNAVDWFNLVSGTKSGFVTPDNEGNVLSVSQ